MTRVRVLLVAGSDSAGAAGLQADLRTVSALGGHGLSAVTAVTAQSSLGVRGSWPVPADVVAAQVRTVIADIGVDAVKTGMLGTADIVRAVAAELAGLDVPLVIDPVLSSTSGTALLSDDGVAALLDELIPLATVVTPNAAELARLGGMSALLGRGARWVLATGGDPPEILAGGPEGHVATDTLTDGVRVETLSAPRIDSAFTRGTGCTLATALATLLAQGRDVVGAARAAKDYVSGAIAHGYALGERGGGGAGVPDQLWRRPGA